jgi:predicted kinase
MTQSSTLYLTCGLPGSGKTTLAKQLEQSAAALRLTGDEWLQELFPHMSTVEAETGPFRSRVERLQWLTAARALELGCNVVVDWGVWARTERDVFRVAARAVGARVVLCLLDPPLDELWARVSSRNAERPFGTFEMTRADLLRWSELFQRPTADELALYDAWEARDFGRGSDRE